jgi:SpoVK/Ycf46/Vps4 family AAA+-type ATPase
MEAFNGIFICTTNLMERLDLASLRRFSFKVAFDYLNKGQSWEMFKNELVRLGGKLSDREELRRQVCSLTNLTPGDFAVAARQFVVLDMPITEDELFRQLLTECQLKTGGRRGIGFVV